MKVERVFVLLYLMGYRGTGKSSIGVPLASRLSLPLVDLDQAIEAAAGKSIAAIFQSEGETGFRQREGTALEAVVANQHTAVVALGGGAVLREENQRLIRRSGKVVWLRASIETICARISSDRSSESMRPALMGKSAVEEVAEILQQRLPIYARLADLEISTDQLSAEAIAETIAAWWLAIVADAGTRQD